MKKVVAKKSRVKKAAHRTTAGLFTARKKKPAVTAGPVEGTSFNLVDSEGRRRAHLGMLVNHNGDEIGPALSLLDAEDRERVRLSLYSDGLPSMRWNSADGLSTLFLYASRRGGKETAKLVLDANGKTMVSIGIDDTFRDGEQVLWPSITLEDGHGNTIRSIGGFDDPAGSVDICGYRVAVVEPKDWTPTHWSNVPSDAKAVEILPESFNNFADAESAVYGFNTKALKDGSLTRWAVMVAPDDQIKPGRSGGPRTATFSTR